MIKKLFNKLFGTKSVNNRINDNAILQAENVVDTPLVETVDDRLKAYFESQQQFPCHIKKRTRSGFIVHGLGGRGFLPFKLMPWTYDKWRSWVYVADDFIGKRLFCCVEELSNREVGYVRFIASADVHHYYSARLCTGTAYRAVVLHINHSHVLLELGAHFEWEKGSMLAVQHRSEFEDGVFESVQKGQRLEVIFQCYHESGIAMCGSEGLDPTWYDVTWSNSEGEVLLFDVIASETGKKPRLFYNGYEARLLVHKLQFGEDRKKVDLALRRLETGDKLEAYIVKYYPERGYMKVRLTEPQAESLLSESEVDKVYIGKLYEEVEHPEGMIRYTLVHKDKGVVALLEQNVEVIYERMEVKPLIEIMGGPYQPKYQIWTTKTNPVAIVKDYYDHLFLTRGNDTVLGSTSIKGKGYIEEMWEQMKDGLFFQILLDRLSTAAPYLDLDVTREKDYWIVKGPRFNILMDYGPSLKFRFMRWWETLDYNSIRYIRVRVSHKGHRRLSIQIDHHRVIVGRNCDNMGEVIETCLKHFFQAIGREP